MHVGLTSDLKARMLRAILLFLLLIAILCIQFQHSILYAQGEVTLILQQVPDEVAKTVHAVVQDVTSAHDSSSSSGGGGDGTALTAKEKRRAAKLVAKAAAKAAAIEAATADTNGGMQATPQEVGAAAPECAAPRKPYHVVLTAASGTYQEWQSRIAYYHYKKLKAENPCSDLGGFTRLLNTPGARPDGLMDEIPTVLVAQLSNGNCDSCDHGFIVMNRPWGVRQLLKLPHFAKIPEEYILLMETDHLFLKVLPNFATPSVPVGFGFYYMTYKYDPAKLKPVISNYFDPDQVDPVGPSPVIIHKKQLLQLTEPWWQLCLTLKRDPAANRDFGWVLEMWAWALASAKAGVRHKVLAEFQAEPGGMGIDRIDKYYLYHYTFDLDTGDGWQWSKRQLMMGYPTVLKPPAYVMKRGPTHSTRRFVEMMNEAIEKITPWKPLRQKMRLP